MAVVLKRDRGVSLQKGPRSTDLPELVQLGVELAWSSRATDGAPVDLDLSVVVCGSLGRALSDAHLVYYNNPDTPDGAVRHLGDDQHVTTHDERSSREAVEIDLARLPRVATGIAVVASMHAAQARGQNFGSTVDAAVTVRDAATGTQFVRWDLAEDSALETAVVVAHLARDDTHRWSVNTVGRGWRSGLAGILADYGVNLA